mgnify:CR=1 FL=1
MPGASPSGAVVEAAAHHTPELIAHELGHYLGLHHEGEKTNLMNPVIYRDSTELSEAQCSNARKGALTVRSRALREPLTRES